MADAQPLDCIPLPLLRTRFIGRDFERATGRSLLLDDAIPFLSLTGPGGVGKTRLALAIAADVAPHFADGVVWIDLAPVREPALVAMMVASALGITPTPGRPVAEELARHLRPRQTLLLFDNCEHVLAGTAELVAGLLASCPALQILGTSRAPLHIRGEQVLPVEPLPLPMDDESSLGLLQQNEAVRLFVERARAARPAFQLSETNAATVAAICHSLDGLPLAIELAAARITILSPDALLAQMTHRLFVLNDGPRDAPTRQQTMAATIDWSYDLLDLNEKAMFRQLAVFSGGFTLEAAQAIAGERQNAHTDIVGRLGTLIDHSLVHRMDRDDVPRLTMLETIRESGLARLDESGEETATRDRHSAYFLDLVKSLETWTAPHLPETQQILDRLEVEYANLRAALTWQRETGDVAGLLALAAGLFYLWQRHGHLHEGRGWLEWGLGQDVEVPAPARADGQLAFSRILHQHQDFLNAMKICEASLHHFRASADSGRIARACELAAVISLDIGGPDLTNAYIEGALSALVALGDAPWARRAASHMLFLRGVLAKNNGDLLEAERYLREAIAEQRAIARESGIEHPSACRPLLGLGATAHVNGDLATAFECYQASLDHAWRFHDAQCVASTMSRVAGILAADGRWREAARLFGATEAFCEKSGFAFHGNIWQLTRAFGLPQPWQGAENFVGQAAGIRAAVLRYRAATLPPLPDPAAAAEHWSTGRGVPIEQAVNDALAVMHQMPSAFPFAATSAAHSSHSSAHRLTPRQQEILVLLCERLTDPEIAARMFISPRTVEGHVTQILGKLGAESRREAAAIAARHALV
ncbi:MAG: hypothetical protein H0V00_15660 [Chloroflexia bacterium]|nr:hypothetical protein [Chloroflexia bacterium]